MLSGVHNTQTARPMLKSPEMKRLEPKAYRLHVLICKGKDCTRQGADDVAKSFRRVLKQQGAKEVRLTRTYCLGQCKHACVIAAEGPKAKRRWWGSVTPDDAVKLAKKLLKKLDKTPKKDEASP